MIWEYEVARASMVYRCALDRMLPALPGPGTDPFAKLCRSLRPYGISPTKVTIEAPTSRLEDVILSITDLLEGRINLRLSYGWFEISDNELYEGDEAAL